MTKLTNSTVFCVYSRGLSFPQRTHIFFFFFFFVKDCCFLTGCCLVCGKKKKKKTLLLFSVITVLCWEPMWLFKYCLMIKLARFEGKSWRRLVYLFPAIKIYTQQHTDMYCTHTFLSKIIKRKTEKWQLWLTWGLQVKNCSYNSCNINADFIKMWHYLRLSNNHYFCYFSLLFCAVWV